MRLETRTVEIAVIDERSRMDEVTHGRRADRRQCLYFAVKEGAQIFSLFHKAHQGLVVLTFTKDFPFRIGQVRDKAAADPCHVVARSFDHSLNPNRHRTLEEFDRQTKADLLKSGKAGSGVEQK